MGVKSPDKSNANDSAVGPADVAEFQQAAEQPRTSLVGEFWYFLRYHKKWWLLPILLILGLFGLLAVLATSGAAPWIYSVM